jgi:hypothetical protein
LPRAARGDLAALAGAGGDDRGMTRTSFVLAALPSVALAQSATNSPARDVAPLAPVWIIVGLVIVTALLVLLASGPRLLTRASARMRASRPRGAR